jgi:hypothetical protein
VPTKHQGPEDFAETAFRVFQEAIGEAPKTEAPAKNAAAVELGRLGGLKGGKARAEKLTADADFLRGLEFFGVVTPDGNFRSFLNPIQIPYEYDRNAQVYVAYEDSLGISCFETDLVKLKSLVSSLLNSNFEDYAYEADKRLSRGGRAIKQNYLRLVCKKAP